jgi:uncharacterized glyoxalase superfamily protein PhnB
MTEVPSVVPMLAYEDGVAAMEWLSRVFGFREIRRMVGPDGRLAHGEMAAGDGIIMLATPTPAYEGPRKHREHCDQARAWSEVPYVIDGVMVSLHDVESHFANASAEGATILSPIERGGPGTRYRAEDLEGHRWMFIERT